MAARPPGRPAGRVVRRGSAYHYGTRRLVFLKSLPLVRLVTELEAYRSAAAALDALVPEGERARYAAALARLADSGVISAR